MSTMTIHYESPAGDPFKVPRPHRVNFVGSLTQKPYGGEIGPLNALLGFCLTPTPDLDDWRVAQPSEVADDPDSYVGWFAQFVDEEGAMFGYNIPIKRIELSEA